MIKKKVKRRPKVKRSYSEDDEVEKPKKKVRKASKGKPVRRKKAKRSYADLPEEMDDPTEAPDGWEDDDEDQFIGKNQPQKPSPPEVPRGLDKVTRVPGFDIENQRAMKLSDDKAEYLSGKIGEGEWEWFVRSDSNALFFWSCGPKHMRIMGYAGPELREALFDILSAARMLDEMVMRYGSKIPKSLMDDLYRIKRWERRLLQNRLAVQRTGDTSWMVRESAK